MRVLLGVLILGGLLLYEAVIQRARHRATYGISQFITVTYVATADLLAFTVGMARAAKAIEEFQEASRRLQERLR